MSSGLRSPHSPVSLGSRGPFGSFRTSNNSGAERARTSSRKHNFVTEDSEDDFDGFENVSFDSDLSISLQPTKLTSSKSFDSLGLLSRFSALPVSSEPVGLSRAKSSGLLLLGPDLTFPDDDLDNDDVADLTEKIPIIRSVSFRISSQVKQISTHLYSLLFECSAAIKESECRSNRAWDAADSDSESDDDDQTQAANALPKIPDITSVNKEWFFEQLQIHAQIYKNGPVYLDNPLLSSEDSGDDNMVKFINSRFIHSLLATLLNSDSRFLSPQLSVLQGLYRYGNGSGFAQIRTAIAKCIAEVISDHACRSSNKADEARINCIDPAHNIVTSRIMYLDQERDRGALLILELLNYIALCESRDATIHYQRMQQSSNIFHSKKMTEEDELRLEILSNEPKGNEYRRLKLLARASCGVLRALGDDDFLQNQPGSEFVENSNGVQESVTVNKILEIQLLLLSSARCISEECGYAVSDEILHCLDRYWPQGKQHSQVQSFILSLQCSLRFCNFKSTYAHAMGLDLRKKQVVEELCDQMKNQVKVLQNLGSRVRDTLIDRCLTRLLRVVNSHHFREARLAIITISGPTIRPLLFLSKKENELLLKTNQTNQKDSLIEQLVAALRENRDSHWHPSVRDCADVALNDLMNFISLND